MVLNNVCKKNLETSILLSLSVKIP
jgi:hypothetical protein